VKKEKEKESKVKTPNKVDKKPIVLPKGPKKVGKKDERESGDSSVSPSKGKRVSGIVPAAKMVTPISLPSRGRRSRSLPNRWTTMPTTLMRTPRRYVGDHDEHTQ